MRPRACAAACGPRSWPGPPPSWAGCSRASAAAVPPFDSGVRENASGICLTAGDDISEVGKVVRHLGYDLTEEDNAKVYEAFRRIAEKKPFISAREMDAIVASTALQVPSTYRMVNYVITCGNAVSAMASVTLEKDGKAVTEVRAGDGPIDAAFLAIEQAVGHHYELDDFQIQTVTEAGRPWAPPW